MPQTSTRQWMSVKIVAIRQEAQDIVSFELADPEGRSLPPFSAGAHIDVEAGDGLVRQYSLCNAPNERHRYLIAVLKVPDSRGGSIAMHQRSEASLINISEPKNHFPLSPAKKTLLFAGGIGVTPILCMAERLAQTGADFEFHYSGRSIDRMAFVDRIMASPFANKVRLHPNDGPADQKLDVKAALGKKGFWGGVPRDVHLYVCGPSGFMDWVLQTARDNKWPDAQLHQEYFSPAAPPTDVKAEAFEVQIASTGKTYVIPADLPITKALRAHGIEIPTSCEEGICGTCVTRVLEGEPDHRDFFLSAKEKARNDQMTPCCSRSKSPKLILDL
jgi:vanillate O-demethylase ferredoxin subunit